jgi:hypothetical protein
VKIILIIKKTYRFKTNNNTTIKNNNQIKKIFQTVKVFKVQIIITKESETEILTCKFFLNAILLK